MASLNKLSDILGKRTWSNLFKRHHLKLSKTKSGEYEGVCLNPKDIPPDDLDDVILGMM